MQADTVESHARETGNVAKPAPDGSPFSAAHACAAALHGWTWYAHHYGLVELSRSDYLAALDAAAKGERYAPADKRPAAAKGERYASADKRSAAADTLRPTLDAKDPPRRRKGSKL